MKRVTVAMRSISASNGIRDSGFGIRRRLRGGARGRAARGAVRRARGAWCLGQGRRLSPGAAGARDHPANVPGAKHMVTGYDHLLFLVGVIFFLYRLKDVIQYVTLFTIGHSITLLLGVLGGIHANPFLIDAVIGFSVVYKAFENMDGFRRFLGFQPNTRAAVLIFGLFHGFGLATKLQDFALSPRAWCPTSSVQRRRGNRAGAGADGHPDRADLLAHAQRVPAARLRDQRAGDGGGIPADRVPALRLLPCGIAT